MNECHDNVVYHQTLPQLSFHAYTCSAIAYISLERETTLRSFIYIIFTFGYVNDANEFC